MRQMTTIALADIRAVAHAVQFTGLLGARLRQRANAGIVFFPLKPFEERKGTDLAGPRDRAGAQPKFAAIKEAIVAVFPPPPVQGLGNTGGFKLYVQDRGALGERAVVRRIRGAGREGATRSRELDRHVLQLPA